MSGSDGQLPGLAQRFKQEPSASNWRELILGPWCVSLQAWLIQSLLGVALVALRVLGLQGLTVTDWLLAALSGPLVSGLVLCLASLTVLRSRFVRPQPVVLVACVWIVVSAFRGGVTAAILDVRGFTHGFSAPQFVANTVFALLWMFLLTYLVAALHYYRSRSEDAQSLLDVTAHHENQRRRLLTDEAHTLTLLVNTVLIPRLADLEQGISQLGQSSTRREWIELAARTDAIVIDQVRSSGRNLAEDAAQPVLGAPASRGSRNRWTDVVENLRTMDLSVWLALAMYGSFGLLIAVPRMGISGFIVVGCVLALSLLVLLSGLLWCHWLGPSRNSGIRTCAVYVILGLVINLALPHLPVGTKSLTETSARPLVLILALIGGVAASMARRYQQRWDDYYQSQLMLLDHYRQLDSDLAREYLRLRRASSRLLHGSVQGKLAAMSLCLKRHAALSGFDFREDAAAAKARSLHLLCEARDIMNSTLGAREAAKPALDPYLSEVQAGWSGLIRIDYDISDDCLSLSTRSPLARESVIAAIEESITNASRHGNARHINVDLCVDSESTDLVLVVVNDGVSIDPNFTPGFGLRTLHVLGLRWSLEPVSERSTRFSARIPTST